MEHRYRSRADTFYGCSNQARLPTPRAGGARFLLRAYYNHLFTEIIKSLERAGGAAAPCPPSVGVPGSNSTMCCPNCINLHV